MPKKSKKNPPISQAELDHLVEQQMREWKSQHSPKITTRDQKTIITLAAFDDINRVTAEELSKLLNLMRVKYEVFTSYISTNLPDSNTNNDAITIEIEGDSQAIATYIQAFINNNYTLPWQ